MNYLKEKFLISFIVVSEKVKYLSISLTKAVKNLYTENYKTFMNLNDTNKWNK